MIKIFKYFWIRPYLRLMLKSKTSLWQWTSTGISDPRVTEETTSDTSITTTKNAERSRTWQLASRRSWPRSAPPLLLRTTGGALWTDSRWSSMMAEKRRCCNLSGSVNVILIISIINWKRTRLLILLLCFIRETLMRVDSRSILVRPIHKKKGKRRREEYSHCRLVSQKPVTTTSSEVNTRKIFKSQAPSSGSKQSLTAATSSAREDRTGSSSLSSSWTLKALMKVETSWRSPACMSLAKMVLCLRETSMVISRSTKTW